MRLYLLIKTKEENNSTNDSFQEFIQQTCVVTHNYKDQIPKAKLDEMYRIWCSRNNKEPVKNRGEAAVMLGISLKKRNVYYYIGVKFKNVTILSI